MFLRKIIFSILILFGLLAFTPSVSAKISPAVRTGFTKEVTNDGSYWVLVQKGNQWWWILYGADGEIILEILTEI